MRRVHSERRQDRVSIAPLNDAQIHGTLGERAAVNDLLSFLPEARVKTNIIILNENGNAEIDCMLLYRGSLFAVEIKSWKGDVYETEEGFQKDKRDPYTGEIHTKQFKSPIKQVRRAISLLKENMKERVYINGVVYIEDNDSLSVSEGSPVFEVSDNDRCGYGDQICGNRNKILFLHAHAFEHLIYTYQCAERECNGKHDRL